MHNHFLIVGLSVFCFLLLLFSAVKCYARRSFLPAEAWILVAGISYGIFLKETDITWLPVIEFNPEIVLFIFLPLLIFASGRLINVGILKAESVPIGFFASIGVIATSFMIGAPVAWVLDIPLLHGLLIGAAAGATDPAAVAAIFHSFRIPERLGLTIEGESLFNDGTTVVLFALISGLVLSNSMFNLTDSLLEFVWAIAGAIPVGVIIGWLGARLLIFWGHQQLFFSISISLVVAYSAFLIGEELLHVSGVIAVLMAAIVFIQTRVKKNAGEVYRREEGVFDAFWEYLADLTNGILFFALGVATGIHDFKEVPFIAVVTAVVAMVLARIILVYGSSSLLGVIGKSYPRPWQHIMCLGGLRGGVSAALILLIPEDYPYRGHFLCLAFAMISFSLIVQPMLLKMYLKRAKL